MPVWPTSDDDCDAIGVVDNVNGEQAFQRRPPLAAYLQSGKVSR